MNSIHKAVLRSFIIMMLVAGVLFTLLGCLSAGLGVPSVTERTRAFTETDTDYFFIYMVVRPAGARAPQSKAELMKYPNVKKRSMPLSRLRFALGSEASAERVYYTDADVQLSLVGHRYVVVHPTTVNPPEDAFNGLTMFYMPGDKDLKYLDEKKASKTIKIANNKDLRFWDAEEVFLKPGNDYVVYWMADYYSEGSERLGAIRFTTHVLEYPTHDLVQVKGEDGSTDIKYKFVTKANKDSEDVVSGAAANATFAVETFYTNAGGPLQHGSSAVGNRVLLRVGEPAFMAYEVRYIRPAAEEMTVFYINDKRGDTLFFVENGKKMSIGPEYNRDGNPFFVSGTPIEEDAIEGVSNVEWFIPLNMVDPKQTWHDASPYKFDYWLDSTENIAQFNLGKTSSHINSAYFH